MEDSFLLCLRRLSVFRLKCGGAHTSLGVSCEVSHLKTQKKRRSDRGSSNNATRASNNAVPGVAGRGDAVNTRLGLGEAAAAVERRKEKEIECMF